MNLMEARRLWALMLAAALVVPSARGIWLTLPSSGPKCISEEIDNNVVVLADYYSFYGNGDDRNSTLFPTISVKVKSPFGNELHHKEKVKYGEFAFTTTEPGNYQACFKVDSDHQNGKTVTVGLDWKIGIAAKYWDSIAKKEKVEGLDLELKKLEDVVEAIHEKMNQLMSKELKMSRASRMTNAKVAQYSIMSLSVCIVASVLQLLYLRRYFSKKKLI
ncbi:hypothetical protein ACS0TY_035590 [Phlomoides rotata]